MTTTDLIKNELREILPLDPGEIYPPFHETEKPETKITTALKALRRNIREKHRKNALINAYFIGQTLALAETSTEEYKLKKRLSTHYLVMSEKVYLLFETNPQQILRTQELKVQDLKTISKPTIRQLLSDLQDEIFFVGTQNLVEEDCYEEAQPQQ